MLRARITAIVVGASILLGGYAATVPSGGDGLANLWIDTNGGTCVRSSTAAAYSDAQACGTFAAAYSAANPGDLVGVKAGTYVPQDLNYDASNAAAPGVTFKEAPGETVLLTGTGADSGMEMGRDGPGSAQYVTFDGIDFDQVYIRYSGSPSVVPQGITIKNGHLGTKTETGLFSGSVRDFTLENVTFGPTCCDEDAAQIAQGGAEPIDPTPDGITVRNVTFRNISQACSQIPTSEWPNCAAESKPFAGNHIDCIQTTGWRNVVIENSAFLNCSSTTLQMGTEKAKSWNITIKNSFFTGGHWVNFTCGGPCGGRGGYISPDSSNNPTWLRLYYNTFGPGTLDGKGLRLQEIEAGVDIVLIGNIIYGDWIQGCDISNSDVPSTTIDTSLYNMFGGGPVCGATSFIGSPTYVQPNPTTAGLDLHLQSVSNGINDGQVSTCALSSDYDGQARPLGVACDIGADEEE